MPALDSSYHRKAQSHLPRVAWFKLQLPLWGLPHMSGLRLIMSRSTFGDTPEGRVGIYIHIDWTSQAITLLSPPWENSVRRTECNIVEQHVQIQCLDSHREKRSWAQLQYTESPTLQFFSTISQSRFETTRRIKQRV